MKDISIYIHIPFCKSKCYYCDFNSFPTCGESETQAYIEALLLEIASYDKIYKGHRLKSLFIGGGTPSLIDSAYIIKIIEDLYKRIPFNKDIEITIEANPESLSLDKLRDYKALGVNRLSLGAQSLDDRILKSIGRIHTGADVYRAVEDARKVGINNLNLDLIMGLPGQDLENLMDSLKKAIDLEPSHISYYSLIIEEGTKFYDLMVDGRLDLVGEDLEREMYHRTRNYLISQGYEHYEISNYSKKGMESKHNLAYWNLEPYLGLGLSAHSNYGGKRFYNTGDISTYINNIKKSKPIVEGYEDIGEETEMWEYCILGLRKIQGISEEDFAKRFKKTIDEIFSKPIKKHLKSGLLKRESGFISYTDKGLDLANQVEIDFLI